MDAQLRLIPRGAAPASEPQTARRDTEPAEAPLGWRIDDTARERGRVGITRAREALRQARRPLPHDHHTTAA
jgi:hypothetical protein